MTQLRGEDGEKEVSLLQQCAGSIWDAKADWKPEPEGADKWSDFLSTLEEIKKEEGDIHSFALSEEWKALTKRYREHLARRYPDDTPKYFSGEINYNVKVSPFDGRENLVVSDVFDKTAEHR